jgi:ferritin-like metal-binding protein YciE
MVEQVRSGGEIIRENTENGARDAALIAAVQRVEHYEIAGYGCLLTYATILKDAEAAALLAQTLEEEKESCQALNDMAVQLNLAVTKERGRFDQQTTLPLTTPGGHPALSQLQY